MDKLYVLECYLMGERKSYLSLIKTPLDMNLQKALCVCHEPGLFYGQERAWISY